MKLVPEAESEFRRQDYGRRPPIDGVAVVPLRRHNDDAGAMTELARLTRGSPAGFEGFEIAQINYSVLEPRVLKAFHVHARQTDLWFVPPEDRVLLVLVDVRDGSPTARHVMRMTPGGIRTSAEVPSPSVILITWRAVGEPSRTSTSTRSTRSSGGTNQRSV